MSETNEQVADEKPPTPVPRETPCDLVEVEERRAKHRLRNWIIRYVLIMVSLLTLMIVGSSLYGWLFLGKDFLGEFVGGYIEHFFKMLHFIFTL